MLDYSLEHLFSYVASFEKPQMIGPLPEGIRATYYVTKGEVTGPKLRGRILPGGGNWHTVRTDGVGILDVRSTLESDDGALIYNAYTGVGDIGEDGYQKFLRGELPASVKIRVAPRFHTSHPEYLWLNRLQCLGIGEVDLQRSEVRGDVYAVR
jgi:Protein of unknown function (DUF3237)